MCNLRSFVILPLVLLGSLMFSGCPLLEQRHQTSTQSPEGGTPIPSAMGNATGALETPAFQLLAYAAALTTASSRNPELVQAWVSADAGAPFPPPVEPALRLGQHGGEVVGGAPGWPFTGELTIEQHGVSDPKFFLVAKDERGELHQAPIASLPRRAPNGELLPDHALLQNTVYREYQRVTGKSTVPLEDPLQGLPAEVRILFGIASAYRFLPPAAQGKPQAMKEELGLLVPEASIRLVEESLGPVSLWVTPDHHVAFHCAWESTGVWFRCGSGSGTEASFFGQRVDLSRSDDPKPRHPYIRDEIASYTPTNLTLADL